MNCLYDLIESTSWYSDSNLNADSTSQPLTINRYVTFTTKLFKNTIDAANISMNDFLNCFTTKKSLLN